MSPSETLLLDPAWLDRSGPVRGEDRPDMERLGAWLAEQPGLPVGPPTGLGQFPGGASNLTFLLEWPETSLVLRMPPRGHKAASAHDMAREVRVLRALEGLLPLVPRVVGAELEGSVLGRPFYLMARVPGLILRGDLPPGLELSPAGATGLCESALQALLAIHSVPTEHPGVAALGKGQGYLERQLQGWGQRYAAAHTEGSPDFLELQRWLVAHRPPEIRPTLIHGDFRFDNLVLVGSPDALRVRAVLDWEMATLGDPRMDLGNALAYWVEAEDDMAMHLLRRQPTHLMGMWTRAQCWQAWSEGSGIVVDNPAWFELFGLFRLAGILQQIWQRVVLGQTRNPAFAAFGDVVVYLDQRCTDRLANPC